MTDSQDFIRHVKTLVNSFTISDSPRFATEFARIMQHDTKFILIPRSASRNYQSAFKILKRKASAANRKISDEQLEMLFMEFLKKLYVNGIVKINTLSRNAQDLFNAVKRFEFSNYVIFVPIRHLSLAIDSIAVGQVEFVRMSDALVQRISIEPKITKMLSIGGDSNTDILQGLQEFFVTECLAIVEVTANDYQKAIHIAIQKIEQSLNVLRFFRIDLSATIDGYGLVRGSTKVLYWNSSSKSPGLTIDSSKLTYPQITITQAKWEERKTLGLAEIHDLLLKPQDQLKQMEEDILSAIYWIGQSLADSSETDAFVRIMVALDILLAQDTRKKKENIARRYASIVYANSSKETILQVYNHLKELYSTRNEIMHAGEKYVDKDSVTAARVYASSLLLLLLKNAKAHPTITDLIEKKFPILNHIFPAIEEHEN